MRSLALGCVVWLLAWAAAGCGTMCNVNGGYWLMKGLGRPTPFGGVVRDFKGMAAVFHEPTSSDPFGPLCVSLFGLADLPMSAAGDVVTLPWVLVQLGKTPPTTERKYLGSPPQDLAPTDGTGQSSTSP